MFRWITDSYFWDLFVTRRWEKMGSFEDRMEEHAARIGLLTERQLAKNMKEYVAAARKRLAA